MRARSNIRSQAAKLLSAEDMMKEAVRLVKRASRAEAWLFAGLPGSSDGAPAVARPPWSQMSRFNSMWYHAVPILQYRSTPAQPAVLVEPCPVHELEAEGSMGGSVRFALSIGLGNAPAGHGLRL